MTITLNLSPKIECGLLARAKSRGISLTDFLQEILTREARVAVPPPPRTSEDLVDACAQVRDVLTNEEIDELFRRNPSPARPIELG